jgi:hypothetical protein
LPRRVVVLAGVFIVSPLAPLPAGQVADWLADHFGNELGGRKDWHVKATEGIATSLGDKTDSAETSSADHG